MEKINIRQVQKEDQAIWDSYVKSHSDSSPYHLYAWKASIELAYKHKDFSLIAEYRGKVRGVLPLVYMHFPWLINQLVALPYCDVGNCLGDDHVVVEELLAEAVKIAKALKIHIMDLRGNLKSAGPISGCKIDKSVINKVRMILELPETSDLLFKSFKSKLRSQIRKAKKNGLEFRWGGIEDLDKYYTVFSKNMRDLGSPVHSRIWFKSILEQFGDNVHMGLVEIEGLPVGAGIIITSGDRVSIPWASTLRSYNRLSPNMLLYWSFLEFSTDNGFRLFDFGRSSKEEGTYKFKAQWGAQATPLNWYKINISGKNKKVTVAGASKREFVANLWRRLPQSMANVIGPTIRKYISL